MTIAAPVSGVCAAHPGVKADWTCQRCGSFVCSQCERRTRPEAAPLCPSCWTLREQAVKDQVVVESRRMQIAGLVTAVLAFHPLFTVASLIVNIRELVKGTGGTSRWMNKVGLALTGVWILSWIGLIIFLALEAH